MTKASWFNNKQSDTDDYARFYRLDEYPHQPRIIDPPMSLIEKLNIILYSYGVAFGPYSRPGDSDSDDTVNDTRGGGSGVNIFKVFLIVVFLVAAVAYRIASM